MIQMLTTYIESHFESLRSDERGQGLVEYALIISLVSVLLIGALGLLKGDIAAVFGDIGEALNPTTT
jgi:pilus assembly protein Flp/PilA